MKLIIGNWKMNGNFDDKENMLKTLKKISTNNKIIMCLPFTLVCGNSYDITIGAQDVSTHENGAYTGDISATMLKDAGVKYVIVGHSERRIFHHETNDIVKQKAEMAIKNGIIPIVCIGETADEKNAGRTMSVIKNMLMESIPDSGQFVVAYEPVWAIGTNKVPTTKEIIDVKNTITKALDNANHKDAPIIYGGSVNATNAKDFISNVDGLLIGHASLKLDTFLPIIKSVN